MWHALSEATARAPASVPKSKPPVSLHGQLLWRDFNNLIANGDPLDAIVQSYEERIRFLEAEIRQMTSLSNQSEVDQNLIIDFQIKLDQLSRENENLKKQVSFG